MPLSARSGNCAKAGFTAAECGTYCHDTGTILNGTLVDVFKVAADKQDSSSSNAPLQALDPADPASLWPPAMTHAYTATPIDTSAEQAALKQEVSGKADAGRL